MDSRNTISPMSGFVCFCSNNESDNRHYFILCLEPGVKVLYTVDDTEIYMLGGIQSQWECWHPIVANKEPHQGNHPASWSWVPRPFCYLWGPCHIFVTPTSHPIFAWDAHTPVLPLAILVYTRLFSAQLYSVLFLHCQFHVFVSSILGYKQFEVKALISFFRTPLHHDS